MEKKLISIGKLTDEECIFIEPILERLAGLEELLLVVEDATSADKITAELNELRVQRKNWWSRTTEKYRWSAFVDKEWLVEYETGNVYVCSGLI